MDLLERISNPWRVEPWYISGVFTGWRVVTGTGAMLQIAKAFVVDDETERDAAFFDAVEHCVTLNDSASRGI